MLLHEGVDKLQGRVCFQLQTCCYGPARWGVRGAPMGGLQRRQERQHRLDLSNLILKPVPLLLALR